MSFPIALITGTGMNELFSPDDGFTLEMKHAAHTPYGGPVRYHTVDTDGLEFLWIDRHYSTQRYCCPHEINPVAYFKVLYDNGVSFVFATTAVGGINSLHFPANLNLGSLVIPEDFIDLSGGSHTLADTKHAHSTAFYRSPRHLFCPHLAELFPTTNIQRGGVISCVSGPRYETRAEIEFLLNSQKRLRLVGMTVSKEAPLAREIAAHYCPIAIVADLPLEKKIVEGTAVEKVVQQAKKTVLNAILQAMRKLKDSAPHNWQCDCQTMPPVFHMLE